jgi:hypothetical protein
MSIDDELTPGEHKEMRDLVLAGTDRIPPTRFNRPRLVAGGVALVLVGAVMGGILTVALRGDGNRGTTASQSDPSETIADFVPPPATPVDVDPQVWISDLPVGEPPLVPYWHDGVLHAPGGEIATASDIRAIEVAGETIMVGGSANGGRVPTKWWLVRGDHLEQLPATDEYYPALSADGRIAYWQTRRSADTTTFVMWDTEVNRELATHTVPGRFDMGNRLQMIGVDAAGIAYWVDESSDTPVMRWDVRAGVVEATNLPFHFSRTFGDQAAPIPDVFRGLEDAYISPDGERQVFTDEAPGDSPADCCETRLRVRPAGALAAVAPEDITTLELPDGIPTMRLWDAYSDRGIWGVWWETNDTVLLDAVVAGRSYLVRCWAAQAYCELVFELGSNTSRGNLYMPDWERDWAFARFPVTD